MSACSILLVSANRHTSPYPVYPLGLSYLKTYLERTINGIRVDIADCNLLSDAQLAERIRTLAPRYIGLSLRNVDGANSLDRRGFLPQYKALADVIRTASDAPSDHRRCRVLDLPRGLHAGAGRRLRHPR